ncbi:cyclic nucleotide-binding-like protein [Dunaliella salina]|uniref:Cyclic nucleotide-binding-like protein n=1 Tax=Dunaliella salina TaxID=3046 RepID=A0ABQ7G9W9_DUNSA|nr:cyclic nucleotide-binding-like protein [Dunaliella salina]|eukprot:KAF5831397.1 cyclic nucleotide-binding-like protein [Dunaliella salina]
MRDEDPRAQYIALVRWLKVGRLYRLFDLFALIEHKVLLSQFMLMLVRNSTYVFYIVHWLACIMYYVARVDGFSENSWLGREDAQARVEGQGLWAKYLYSLYVAMGAFAGVGDEIFYVNSPAETIIMGLYLMLNIAIQAYILGTITIVMVKKDVESQAYRGSVTTLNEFAEANELPKTLYTAMREHVELKFYSERTADEQVLQFYPSTIKRKVLRHLYMEVLKDCYLFHGCKARFLDQVLAAVRMELFMPNVPILNEGDVCNELFLIVDGEVATSAPVDRTARRNSMLGPYDMGPNLDPEFLAGAQAVDDAAEGGGFGAGLMRKARRVSALFMDPSSAAAFGQGGKGGHNRRASNGSVAGSEKSEDVNGMMKQMERSSMQSNGGRRSSMQSNGGRRSSMQFLGGNFGGQGGDSFNSSAAGMSFAGASRNNSAYAVHHSSETFSEVPFFTGGMLTLYMAVITTKNWESELAPTGPEKFGRGCNNG